MKLFFSDKLFEVPVHAWFVVSRMQLIESIFLEEGNIILRMEQYPAYDQPRVLTHADLAQMQSELDVVSSSSDGILTARLSPSEDGGDVFLEVVVHPPTQE